MDSDSVEPETKEPHMTSIDLHHSTIQYSTHRSIYIYKMTARYKPNPLEPSETFFNQTTAVCGKRDRPDIQSGNLRAGAPSGAAPHV